MAIDLFSGAGGLSLGLTRAGFDVVLGIDSYGPAIASHRAHFPGCSLNLEIDGPRSLDPILDELAEFKIALVAGGPPCQPFSIAARWLKNGEDILGRRDKRRSLWRPFLHAVSRLRPDAVLLENVPDLAMGANAAIFRSVIQALVELGYWVSATTLFASDLGVPQHRQRLFLVAFRDKRDFEWPETIRHTDKAARITIRDAISDLPPVEPGWHCGPLHDYGVPKTEYQRRMREGMPIGQEHEINDHVTRAVRPDDLEAFQIMDSKTKYPDLPERLKRYKDTNFLDKYNRLSWEEPSRAIIAHIARDGYWYIHPDQHRSLTIREAARIQSFPDWFRFAGSPSNALRQIGEAVPPIVAEALGSAVRESLKGTTRGVRREQAVLVSRTNSPSDELHQWLDGQGVKNSTYPWRFTGSFWLILLGELVMLSLRPSRRGGLWPNFCNRWPTPRQYLRDPDPTPMFVLARCPETEAVITTLAELLVTRRAIDPEEYDFVGMSRVKLAMALTGRAYELPDLNSVGRLAKRFFGFQERKDAAMRQILVGMLIGSDNSGANFAAALDIAERICSAQKPACLICDLREKCRYHDTFTPASAVKELSPVHLTIESATASSLG